MQRTEGEHLAIRQEKLAVRKPRPFLRQDEEEHHGPPIVRGPLPQAIPQLLARGPSPRPSHPRLDRARDARADQAAWTARFLAMNLLVRDGPVGRVP